MKNTNVVNKDFLFIVKFIRLLFLMLKTKANYKDFSLNSYKKNLSQK